MLDHLYFYSDEISNKAKCNSYSTLYYSFPFWGRKISYRKLHVKNVV